MRSRTSILLTCVLALISVLALAGTARAGDANNNFTTCPAGTLFDSPQAPRATQPARKPTGSATSVPVGQFADGAYQGVQFRAGNQEFPALLDTGSSWIVINRNAVANNPALRYTGRRAAVSYSGGALCVSGLVMRGPISIGGLRPRVMTFLLATGGSFPFSAVFGINTWQPPSTLLDIPVEALRLSQFQLKMTQNPTVPTATGRLTLNAQPTINRARPRDVLTFANRALTGGNRIYVPGTLATSAGQRARGNFMLDIGTPFNAVALFPKAARALGYNYQQSMWPQPSARLALSSKPTNRRIRSMPIYGPATIVGDETLALTPEQVQNPRGGVLGLAGTQAVLGANYVRPWILGVKFTSEGSVVRLLRVDQP